MYFLTGTLQQKELEIVFLFVHGYFSRIPTCTFEHSSCTNTVHTIIIYRLRNTTRRGGYV